MNFLQKLERKFGKYAIKGLTKYIILAYVAGYILYVVSSINGSGFLSYLTLDPYAIMHGQIWRIVTWLLMPPSNLNMFTLIMLICYYQLGTVLERVWGDFVYDFYMFLGFIMTIVGSFIIYFLYAGQAQGSEAYIGQLIGTTFSTYYVSLSIFLGFAMTFPEQQMLLFFIIPIKIKWLAIVDVAYLTYLMIIGGASTRVQIVCSLAATILFFVMTRKYAFKSARTHAKDRKRSREFKQAMGRGQTTHANGARHKCCICGRTELTNPELEFRYCSKCNGNYEYCSDHLFTHVHKT